jgi:predicted chitinase
MDNMKLEDKSMIRIIKPTRVKQASHIVNLSNELEMCKDMAMKKARVSLYIAKAMHEITCTFSYAMKYNCLS